MSVQKVGASGSSERRSQAVNGMCGSSRQGEERRRQAGFSVPSTSIRGPRNKWKRDTLIIHSEKVKLACT